MVSRWTRVEGLRIHARVSADAGRRGGMPVVLVHGLGMSSRYMMPLAVRLAPQIPVYAPDLPGHGRSETPPRALEVPEMADALEGWMEAEGLAQAAFVANSLGCQVVADLAVRHPRRVVRLALVGPTVDPAARSAWRQLARLLASAPAELPSIVLPLLVDYARMGIPRLWRELHFMLADRLEETLPRISVPALVVRGERDAIVPQGWAETVACGLGAPLVVLRGGGHALNYSDAGELSRLLLPFLKA